MSEIELHSLERGDHYLDKGGWIQSHSLDKGDHYLDKTKQI
jgi:hypothetical protein